MKSKVIAHEGCNTVWARVRINVKFFVRNQRAQRGPIISYKFQISRFRFLLDSTGPCVWSTIKIGRVLVGVL